MSAQLQCLREPINREKSGFRAVELLLIPRDTTYELCSPEKESKSTRVEANIFWTLPWQNCRSS